MIFFIDKENKCHVTDDGTMRECEDARFDNKCKEYIEGFYYIPAGETAVINGVEYTGRVLCAFKPFTELAYAQTLYDLEQLRGVQADTDEMLVDHEYRMTMLELFSDTTETA